MKNIFKYLSIGLIGGVIFTACETTNLDLTENPNALTPSQASPDFYLNEVQVKFARLVESLGETGAEVTRIEWMSSRNYQNAYSPSNFDGNWEDAYQEVIKNARDMTVLTKEAGLNHHTGIAQFIEAYTMTLLVDYFGDVPYSEAIGGADNLNPGPDSGADVYAAALSLLDQAIANFNGSALGDPEIDFYYDGDWDAWVRASNTLKLRLHLNLGNTSAFNSIVSGGNFISSDDDDLQFQWGTNSVQPDTRHPNYGQNYTNQGGGDYSSVWLMNLMDTTDDPRMQYYYYRQVDGTPGSNDVNGDPVAPNEETLDCSLQSPPAHYVAGGFPFCTLDNGFWGRNHGNDSGIPPDGLLRTVGGVYPIAGKFDDSSFDAISLGAGGGGNGITPMLLASWVDFWRAEVAMNSSPASGRTLLLAGIAKSIAKVQTFGTKDPGADLSTAPTATDVSDFIAAVGAAFDAGDNTEKWNIMAEQFFTALKGNGHDAFNFYRRKGFPTDLEPNLEPNPGAFIRSFFYPANAANTNSSLAQKSGVTGQVFWDTNPASPTFPVAN
jgi:hypothetical protein